MTAKRGIKPLSLVDVLVAAMDPTNSNLPELLPVADAQVPALFDRGLTEHNIEAQIETVAAGGCRGYAQAVAKFHAWEDASKGGAAVHDPIDGVVIGTRDAAFALGLALGLRIGGAR